MESLRLFAKKDILVVESYIRAGEEIRIGKIASNLQKFMIVCMNDDLHKWVMVDKYEELIEDRLVEII
jgi:hypothetical protein